MNGPANLHEASVLKGFLWGLAVGAVAALLVGPRLPVRSILRDLQARQKTLRARVEERVAADPVTDSLTAAKEAARRRLDTAARPSG